MTELTALGYGGVIAGYLTNKNIYSHIVIYEKLIENVINETKTLFGKLDISLDYVNDAITALDKDSQGNVFGTAGKNKTDIIKDWKIVDDIFNLLDLPMNSDMTIEEMSSVLI